VEALVVAQVGLAVAVLVEASAAVVLAEVVPSVVGN
jgi:hypothetical protein